MKRLFTPYLFLFIILVSSSCERLRCDGFDRFNPVIDIALFSDESPVYEFTNTINSTNDVDLTFNRQSIEFSSPYNDTCQTTDGCNCYSTYRTRYYSPELQLGIGNDIAILYEDEFALELIARYLSFDENNQITDGQNIDFSPFDDEIIRDVNNLVRNELVINGETFNEALRIDFNAKNITLFVERFRGLQGILYEGNLYKRIN